MLRRARLPEDLLNRDNVRLSAEALRTRTRFVLRTVSAVIRDTLFAGPGKGRQSRALEDMVVQLTEMATSHLQVER